MWLCVSLLERVWKQRNQEGQCVDISIKGLLLYSLIARGFHDCLQHNTGIRTIRLWYLSWHIWSQWKVNYKGEMATKQSLWSNFCLALTHIFPFLEEKNIRSIVSKWHRGINSLINMLSTMEICQTRTKRWRGKLFQSHEYNHKNQLSY